MVSTALPSAPAAVDAFIARWDGTERAERANYIPFLNELCDLLGVPRPEPAKGSGGAYRFERSVTHYEADGTTTTRRIDLFKRDCFVLEAKQGASQHRTQASLFPTADEAQHRANVRETPGWARYMLAAKGQAEGYARDLPAAEGWPPFLIVCDVGFCLDLYSDFSGMGKHYAQFPDLQRFRLYLPDLRDAAVRDRLRMVWTDPLALNPARRRTEVTRQIAALLARLAVALEGPRGGTRHAPQHVATFLMRGIFCMFAQSVGLLPEGAFTALLERCRGNPPAFVGLIGDLWRSMDAGGFSAALAATVLRFNGGLFRAGVHGGADPLPVQDSELDLLILASRKDWSEVEPAIFGTLLENALDKDLRARLGAQFTPRAFVERLVLPTVMEPLRLDWDGVRAAAETALNAGDAKQAAALVRDFHARLCHTRVLDPACGTGNFLYVTLELMKRLEGEVLDALAAMEPGAGRLDMAGAAVDPHQFLGLDKNPRAVPVAELVLWIGYLQWHFRTHGHVPPAEPILRDFRTIQERDALLDYARTEPHKDKQGAWVTRWGGRTTLQPITGEAVPDETDQVMDERPVRPKPAAWPDAEFIVGNPPFVAGKDMRQELGNGYAEALWAAYPKVPRSADLALFFWRKAAQLAAAAKVRRFGFITSNSLRQKFCRQVLADAITARKPLHLVFAIPDHPWAQGRGTAAVRIAMTVAERGRDEGKLWTVTREDRSDVPTVEFAERKGTINADLTMGATPADAQALRANERICSPGVKLHGAGFIVSPATAAGLGLGKVEGLSAHIRPYLNGRDITGHSRNAMIIDLFGLTEEQVRKRYPAVFQHILLRVKPERDAKKGSPDGAQYARDWWLFGKTRPELRAALDDLSRYIATVETAKHRTFFFLPASVLPDNRLICVASADAFHLGVLSSRIHVAWALAIGALLEDRPIYTKSLAYDPFPFPAATAPQRTEIAALAEELDAHRKRAQADHPHLTLTLLYNVLDAIRSGRALTPAERDVLDAGQVAVLRHLHDRLDAAVAAAYGWPADLAPDAIVERVVALNRERVGEEAEGLVRWLRPDYQAGPELRRRAEQGALDVAEGDGTAPPWPRKTPEQFVALRAALSRGGPARPRDLARLFRGVSDRKLDEMLRTLVALGQARDAGAGRYAG